MLFLPISQAKPTQLCPKIPACAECEKCNVILPENETANLNCFIEGVRSQPVMYWTYEGVANVTKNESHCELTNHTRVTWTVSTMIVYKMPCGETAVFNCYIHSDGWLLNMTLTSKVEVNSAIICIGISVCLTRSYTTSRKRKDPLKDALKKYFLKPFNSGVNSSYAVCDCVIRTSEGDAYDATSDNILKESFFNNSDCVIFTGKVGYGKTYLFQHVARLWAKGEILQNAIVIYIKLKPFCKKACILEEVVKSMDGQFQSVEAFSNILQEQEEHIPCGQRTPTKRNDNRIKLQEDTYKKVKSHADTLTELQSRLITLTKEISRIDGDKNDYLHQLKVQGNPPSLPAQLNHSEEFTDSWNQVL
ncbi:hypothetical protein BSL78_19017 [Apostichopus japonicus]|uniref:Ig-like domain-containing protein n=1 Tax=Stichopus japonicus TaxID=307972 RepID=A0A2G8K853_STIJA|nr:hypothetical protein BSL78_19017 [Apostichopus japonicus]